jgi:hypothetical protein
MQTFKAYYKSPLGPIEIVGSQDSIIALDFVEEMLPEDGELTFCVKECLKQIDEYFKRERRKFYLNLQPALTGPSRISLPNPMPAGRLAAPTERIPLRLLFPVIGSSAVMGA